MRIIVTGGAGYIGSHTIVDLLKIDTEVQVIDNFSNSSEKVFENIKKITGKKILYENIDLLDFNNLSAFFKKTKPSLVIHFAGLKSVSESMENPILYYNVNVNGTINLLKAMDLISCKKIIFSSSATVYGVPEYFPVDENHKCNPINTYGRTKYFIEHIIKDWSKNTNEKKAIILRYFNPAGAHETGFIGEDPKGIPNNLFPFITHVISGREKELNVYGNDYNTKDGTGVRDYIHVNDLADAHIATIGYLLKNQKDLTINLGTGIGYSVLEIIKTVEKITNRKVRYRFGKRREGDPPILIADPTKANQELGWEAKYVNIETIINKFLNYNGSSKINLLYVKFNSICDL